MSLSSIFYPLLESPIQTLQHLDNLRNHNATKMNIYSLYKTIFDIADNKSLKKKEKIEKIKTIKQRLPEKDGLLRSYGNYMEHRIKKTRKQRRKGGGIFRRVVKGAVKGVAKGTYKAVKGIGSLLSRKKK